MAQDDSFPRMAISVAQRTFYSNPYWSDPTDPTRDENVLFAARTEAQSIAEFHERFKKSLLLILVPIAVTFIAFVFGLASDEPNSLSFFFLCGCGTVGVGICLYGWTVAAHTPGRRAIDAIRQQSWQRYQNYVQWLQANDPAKYGLIVQWHQQQEMIRMQQEAAERQRQMLRNQERMIEEQMKMNQRLQDEEQYRRSRNRNGPFNPLS